MRPAIVALLVLVCGTVHAAEKPAVWIASGEAGGTYRGIYANNFEKHLRSYDVFHRMTTGSGENLELLVSGRADVAFAQADIYAAQLRQDPERLEDVVLRHDDARGGRREGAEVERDERAVEPQPHLPRRGEP